MNRILASILAVAFLLRLCASDVTDLHPPYDAPVLVSFNRGDHSNRGWQSITTSNVGGVTYVSRNIQCDGDGDGIGLGSTVLIKESTAAPFSVSIWAYPTSIETTGFSAICGLRTSASATFQWWLTNVAGYADMAWGTETWGEMKVTLSTFLNRWNHFVLTYDGTGKQTASAWKLYQDGVSKTVSASSVFVLYNVNSGIGKFRTADNTADFIGYLDDFRLYDRALSADEVMQIYSSTIGDARTP